MQCVPIRIVASFIYRQQDSPRYTLGHTVCITSLCLLYVPILFNISWVSQTSADSGLHTRLRDGRCRCGDASYAEQKKDRSMRARKTHVGR